MQKKLLSHCHQRQSEDDRFATGGLLTTVWHWSAGRQWWKTPTTWWKTGENCCWLRHVNHLWQKQKFSSTASSQSQDRLEHYCSMDKRSGRYRRIWKGESRPFITNVTEECLAYHTVNIKQTNMCDNRSTSSLNVRSLYCQAFQAIIVRPCLSSWYAAKNHTSTNSLW